MRNAEAFVQAAIASVSKQQEMELEVVVVDNGSTDSSAAVVRSMGDGRVRLVPGPEGGIAATFNAALAAARGDIIVRCDADDLFPPDRLAWQVRWLTEHAEFGAVCGRFTTMSPKGQVVAELECGGQVAEEITGELRNGATRTSLCTFAVRTELLRQVGGCRPFFVTAEDIDLQLRLGEIARVWFEPRSCYFYRLHDASITHSQGNTLKQFFEQTARTFAAQRRSGQPDDLQQGRPPPVPAVSPGGRFNSGQHLQGMLLSEAWREHAAGRRLRALRTGLRACLSWPRSLGAWKSLVALAYKRRRAAP
jgi:glycosyltransferase involved in cell wall biosynthesis